MKKISLDNVFPDVFRGEKIESDIWSNTFNFETGQNYLIQSASGKGKSSLCSYIFGYRNDYSGNILFDTQNLKAISVTEWDKIRTHEISLLFQELRLFPELTVIENILMKNNLTNFKTKEQIREMLEQLDIENKIDAKIGKMSWGQQQRVAIVRAMCQPFSFLLLDEPISHLDDENTQLIAKLVSDEASKQGASVIVTSIGKHLPLTYNQTFAL